MGFLRHLREMSIIVPESVEATEASQTHSTPISNDDVIVSDEEKSSDTGCTLISQSKDTESCSNEKTASHEQFEKEVQVEVSPTLNVENSSAFSSRNSNEHIKESVPSIATVNKNVEYPTLKSILNSPRKRTATKKAHERRKRIANLPSIPSRKEMTMVDLIYWNPTTSPMKSNKPATKPAEEDLLPSDENAGPSLPPEEQENLCTAPKVIINADGEIILDESSLFVRRKDTVDKSGEPIIENDNTTYSSFRKRSVKTWSKKETAKFYKALSLVGTDFALMESIFQSDGKVTRTRRELKLKFKREEKLHPDYVHTAMYELQTYDVSIWDDDSDEMTENSEVVDDAPKRTKKPVDTERIKNPSGRGRKKKTDLQEENVDESIATTENTPDIIEGEVIKTVNLENNNEASGHENAAVLNSKISRPERTRKAKTLTDFVTNLDDLSDTNDLMENEEDSLLFRRRKKVQVLSEESEDNIIETVDRTEKMNELECNSSDGKVNFIQDVTSKETEITHEKGPLPVKRKRKLQVMPKTGQNNEEISQIVTTVVPEIICKTSRSGRKRKAKNMSDFITDPDALREVDEDDFDVNSRYLCEMTNTSNHLEETVLPEDGTEEIQVAVNSISFNESSPLLAAECTNILSTEKYTKCLTEESIICTSECDKLNHTESWDQNSKDIAVKSSIVTNSGNLDNPNVMCLSVSPPKEPFSTVISLGKASISNVLNLPDSETCSSISVNNLLTDAVISEVVTSEKRVLRTRKRVVLPNVAKGSKRPAVFPKKQPSFTSFTPVDDEIQQPVLNTYSKFSKMETSQDLQSSLLTMETSNNCDVVARTYSASDELPNPSNSTFASTEVLSISKDIEATQTSHTNRHSSTLSDMSKSVKASRASSSCMSVVSQASPDLSLNVPLIDPNTINMTPVHQSDSPVVILTQFPSNENILHVFMCQKS
ncbi:transcription factor TFIIIB component B [Nephila pilipes]|uniref:Transcription factor TFIIIB component B n=1 Tax=Nephila pilipes TaxID=299642 RepID=A0A8X6NUQ7_NEPPI|nr:transcription factor TFIIIB component B [Nephila pilipes]